MRDSIKQALKMPGLENAEKAPHPCLYGRWPFRHLYHPANTVGPVDKYPGAPIPPEVEEMIQILAMKVARGSVSAETCPFHAMSLEEVAVVDAVNRMGCGACEAACEYGAMNLRPEPSKGEPPDIKRLIEEKQGA